MTTILSIATLIVLSAVLATFWVIKVRKSNKRITDKEMKFAINTYRNAPFIFDGGKISGRVNNVFVIQSVLAYGVKYSSLEEMLEKCSDLRSQSKRDICEEVEDFINLLSTINAEIKKEENFYEFRQIHGEQIYIYNEGEMLVAENGHVMVNIQIDATDKLTRRIVSAYSSDGDVFNKLERFEYDLLNPEDVKSFDLLVRDDEFYKEDIEAINALTQRIAYFNKLVSKNRVSKDANGSILISPPSPADIIAGRK